MRDVTDPATGEVTQVPAIAPIDDRTALASPIKIKKRLTLAVLSVPDDSTVIFKVITAIRTGKVTQKDRKPAEIMTVASIYGEERLFVCGTIVEKELKEQYSNDKYVGCWFQLTKHARRVNPKTGKMKTYNEYDITEIEPPNVKKAAE